jgi:transposase
VIDVSMLSLIRRLHLREGISLREIARRTGVSRNTIKKYLAGKIVEPRYKARPARSKLAPYAEQLIVRLKTAARAARKQRKSVKQMYRELAGLGYEGSYDRVIAFARRWRAEQIETTKTTGRGTFVPLIFHPGEAFQFDWSEDWAVIAGERTKLQVAHFKLAHSRAFILRAYLLQTHEMLFDAHHHGFAVLGGVARRGIYDNMKTAVDKIGSGKARDINVRFAAMVSHYVFHAEFCNPASGWEKGQVEKNVQDARHRLWHHVNADDDGKGVNATGARSFASLAALNDWLAQRCQALWSEIYHPEQTQRTIAQVWGDERKHLMALPPPFDGFIEHTKRVSPTCLIHVERNRYSVPASFANRPVSVRLYADRIVIVAEGNVIAEHGRLINRDHRAGTTIYDWRHYLAVLQRKPGALRNGAPFTTFPEGFKQLQAVLMKRPGGDREMVDILALVLHHDESAVLCAVELALESGAASKPHILNILSRLIEGSVPQPLPTPAPHSPLSLKVEPEANVTRYDSLRAVTPSGGRHAA